MKYIFFLAIAFCLSSCKDRNRYDVNIYLAPQDQREVLAGIINHIYTAPLYTRMEDRFLPQHKAYYLSLTTKFTIAEYFVDKDSTHYFYVIRPSSVASEKRGVGGHFKMAKDFSLKDFREEYVTTVMSETDLKGRAAFLFDEMVKGNLSNYIEMKDYIQWPNNISYYDTITYEWKLKPGAVN